MRREKLSLVIRGLLFFSADVGQRRAVAAAAANLVPAAGAAAD